MLIVYSTSACHLCDQALGLLDVLVRSGELGVKTLEVELVDIADDVELFERFGRLIPVIESSVSLKTLEWPFTKSELSQFIQINEVRVR